MLMSPGTQHMVIAVEMPASDMDLSHLSLDDPDALEQQAREIIASASAQSEDMSVDQFSVEDVVVSTVGGKRYPVLFAKIRQKRAEEYSPAAVAMLPLADGRAALLLNMDPASETTNPDEDFSELYAVQDQELQALIESSTLDERLQSIGNQGQ